MARRYWDKARDFFRLRRDAAAAGNWNGVGLAGVPCAISATDELLAAKAGRGSSSLAHEDAANLLLQHVHDLQTAEQSRHPRQILREKTLIECVDRFFHRDDALSLQKQVERNAGWAQSLLNL